MEAIRKQASKLREQVAKQQQAVLKQLGQLGHESVPTDEGELQCYQQLQNLYGSTRAAKHFQKSIVRGVEGFIATSAKQMEIVKKLAEDCCNYGNENQLSGSALGRISLHFGTSHNLMEKERESLLRTLGDQVSEPLRTSIMGSPLEDARHLTHRYYKLRQEVEGQAAEVLRRLLKTKEAGVSSENDIKLQNAEAKLSELKSTMMALGKEATAAMLSVDVQQKRTTYQRLLTMVDAERSYHQSVAAILEKLHAEMVLENQHNECSSRLTTMATDVQVPPEHEGTKSSVSVDSELLSKKDAYFIAKDQLRQAMKLTLLATVIHPFDAQADGELSLFIGDYIVVRQVTCNGWSEGECKGKAGWFPSAYIERQDKAPASKIIEATA